MEFLKFVFPIFISVLLSCILLLPTLYTILNGRVSGNTTSLLSLLIPKVTLTDTLYGGYAIGLTSVLILGIVNCICSRKKDNIFLGIVMALIFIFPIFMYVLNARFIYFCCYFKFPPVKFILTYPQLLSFCG